jgi:Protein of unknown function (DUF4239)
MWLLQLPEWLVAFLAVVITVALSVLGLIVSRRIVSRERLEKVSTASEPIFTLAGVLYAVLVAFVVVVVWEQFGQAQRATESEATAIADLLRDSEGLPAAAQPAIRQSLIAYTHSVSDEEYPRMRRGEAVEEQSAQLTEIWHSYFRAEPVTQSQIAFYRESLTRLDELGSARKSRLTGSEDEIPSQLWVLLLGGGVLMLVFTYLYATSDMVLHGALIGLAAALMAFVLYLIFTLEHPFVGSLSVPDGPYRQVLELSVNPATHTR